MNIRPVGVKLLHADGRTDIDKETGGKTDFLPWRNRPQGARTSSLLVLHNHTQTHHTWWNSTGQVISPAHRHVPANRTLRSWRHPSHEGESNLQSQQASGRRPNPRRPAQSDTIRHNQTQSDTIRHNETNNQIFALLRTRLKLQVLNTFSSDVFSSVQFCSVLFSSVQFCSVLFSSVQFRSVLFSSVQFSFCSNSDVRWGLPNPLTFSGHYTYHQFNIQQLYVLPTQCIYLFCVDLRTNSDYFPIQH